MCEQTLLQLESYVHTPRISCLPEVTILIHHCTVTSHAMNITGSIRHCSHFGTGELHVPSALHVAELGPSRDHPSAASHVTVVEFQLVLPQRI